MFFVLCNGVEDIMVVCFQFIIKNFGGKASICVRADQPFSAVIYIGIRTIVYGDGIVFAGANWFVACGTQVAGTAAGREVAKAVAFDTILVHFYTGCFGIISDGIFQCSLCVGFDICYTNTYIESIIAGYPGSDDFYSIVCPVRTDAIDTTECTARMDGHAFCTESYFPGIWKKCKAFRKSG